MLSLRLILLFIVFVLSNMFLGGAKVCFFEIYGTGDIEWALYVIGEKFTAFYPAALSLNTDVFALVYSLAYRFCSSTCCSCFSFADLPDIDP